MESKVNKNIIDAEIESLITQSTYPIFFRQMHDATYFRRVGKKIKPNALNDFGILTKTTSLTYLTSSLRKQNIVFRRYAKLF